MVRKANTKIKTGTLKINPSLTTFVSCFLFFKQTPKRQSRLFCRYYDNNRNPRLLLAPVKQQDEWDRPYIVRFLDIISEKEMEKIKQLAKPRVSDALYFL